MDFPEHTRRATDERTIQWQQICKLDKRGGNMRAASQEEITRLAQKFWEQRGRPAGSPETDWRRAKRALEGRLPNLARTVGTALGQAVSFVKPRNFRIHLWGGQSSAL
jgi:Protein of unknown function (DUF2934)